MRLNVVECATFGAMRLDLKPIAPKLLHEIQHFPNSCTKDTENVVFFAGFVASCARGGAALTRLLRSPDVIAEPGRYRGLRTLLRRANANSRFGNRRLMPHLCNVDKGKAWPKLAFPLSRRCENTMGDIAGLPPLPNILRPADRPVASFALKNHQCSHCNCSAIGKTTSSSTLKCSCSMRQA